MSPEKIISHEPTAVKRDTDDQEIAEGGKTGTDSAEAKEKYRKELAKQNIEGTIFIFTILTHMELTLIQ